MNKVHEVKGPARGVISNEKADNIAQEFFGEIKDLNNWDRRRILQRLERLNRERRAA